VGPRTDAGAERAGKFRVVGLSGQIVAVFLDMMLDDISSFARRILSVGTGAAHQFLLELRRNVVEEDGLFAGIEVFRRVHQCDMFLISASNAGQSFLGCLRASVSWGRLH
jgi:hypothetical protein